MKNIIFGVTGSISAYKAADIANRLTKSEICVNVIMTASAEKFITPLTLRTLSKNFVYTDMFCEDNPDATAHISLAKCADALLVAPATANIIGKIANGVADDMLTATVLAVQGVPRIIAPAMNERMLANEAVQENLAKLAARGWQIIEPRDGHLACGGTGKGALADVENIISAVKESLGE